MKTSQNKRIMTQSPVALAQMALKAAQEGIETYSSHFSRKDFTQPQLFAILALQQFFSTDYRGVIQYLHDFSDLRQALKLKRVPHYSTLCYAEKRLLKKGLLKPC